MLLNRTTLQPYGEIHIWNDPWISSIPGFRAIKRTDSTSQVSRVSELLLHNATQWNTSLVNSLFVPHIANAVLQLQLSNEEDDDNLIWMPGKNGEFTTKSMYKHLVNDIPSGSTSAAHTRNFKWSNLWKIRGVAPRITLFIWRALHEGLAVGNFLKRMFGGVGNCSICNNRVETVEHCLFQCPRIAAVWDASCIQLPQMNNSCSLSMVISDWMKKDLDIFRRGVVILWVVWKSRNDWVFSSKSTTTEEMLYSADLLFHDYKLPPEVTPAIMQQSSPLILHNHWLLPPPTTVKINFDGACMNGEIAAGAVIREDKGFFLGCICKAQHFGAAILAEAQGCLLAIELINRLHLSNVIVEGDSKIIIDSIYDDHSVGGDWRITPTIRACRRMVAQETMLNFSFLQETPTKWLIH